MSETSRLADLVMRVIDGDPWHGPNVMTLLDGVSPRAAAAHPLAGGHSIWELVLHMTGWADEVRARLGGAEADEPTAGDWPEVTATSRESWATAMAALVESHVALAAALRAADDRLLDTAVRDHRDRAGGTGLSHYLTLHGLVHHTTYHAGQIAMLVKAARAAES